MSGGYLMPDGTIVLDQDHETSPAAIPETSPCGQQEIKQQSTKKVDEESKT